MDRARLDRKSDLQTGRQSTATENIAVIRREVSLFFRKFEKYDLLEGSCRRSSHFLLSGDLSQGGSSGEIPGLLLDDSETPPGTGNESTLLLRHDSDNPPELRLAELRLIIRELVIGIYVFNEIPRLRLETPHDVKSGVVNCILPPPYVDTRVGQTLISILVAANCVSYGVHFGDERRRRFAEHWRDLLVTDNEKENEEIFHNAGLVDLADDDGDAELWRRLDEPFQVRDELEKSHDLSQAEIGIVVKATEATRHADIFQIDSTWTATTRMRTVQDELDFDEVTQTKCCLQAQRDYLRRNLAAVPDVQRQLDLLRFIGTMTQYLVSLKSYCKIPVIDLSETFCHPDDLKTERELPSFCAVKRPRGSPLACLDKRKLIPFRGHVTFFPIVLPVTLASQEIAGARNDILKKSQECKDDDAFASSLTPIGGRQFLVLDIALENYYATSPKVPSWLHVTLAEFSVQTASIVGAEARIYEALRRRLGSKQLAKIKSANVALVVAAQRGILCVFQNSAKRSAHTRLSQPYKETGLALAHQAALYDQPAIIHWLAQQGCDLDVRRGEEGATALHIASRCGSTESVCCLMANRVDLRLYDSLRWLAVHHAAFQNHVEAVSCFIVADPNLLNATTDDVVKATPVYLASRSGALDAVKRLVHLGADIAIKDDNEKTVVHAAAMQLHVNVLRFFISCESPSLPVWSLLADMLKSPVASGEPERAARCLYPISKATDLDYVASIVKADAVAGLYGLLKCDEFVTIQARAALVLQNISNYEGTQKAIVDIGAVATLVKLLCSPSNDVQARVANVIADVGRLDSDQVAEDGAIESLIPLLSSADFHVRFNSARALQIVVNGSRQNQNTVRREDGILPLVALLALESENMQMLAAETVRVVAGGNVENQNAIVGANALPILIHLLRSRNFFVQIQAAGAIEAIVDGNRNGQRVVLTLNGVQPLKRMLKFKNADMKIRGACALWAVAGDAIGDQREIAARIGIDMLTQLLALGHERLNVVSAQALYALASGPSENRDQIARKDGVAAVVRLLRPREKASVPILLEILRTLAALCVGPAHSPHIGNQNTVAEKRGLELLSHLLTNHPDPLINAKAGWVLSCTCLCNVPVQKAVVELADFNFARLASLLESDSRDVSLHAGMALSTFAYNSPLHQRAITSIGGVDYSVFAPFLTSLNDEYRAHAAFQTVVLAKVLTGRSDISTTVEGLEILVDLLKSSDEASKILSAELLASLAHTRPGVPDGIVAAGAPPLLFNNLTADVKAVSASAAIALGYLTFNGTAARILLKLFRDKPEMYRRFRLHSRDGKVSEEFVERWRVAKEIGLPSLSLESKGGPPIISDYRPISGRLSVPLTGHPAYSAGGARRSERNPFRRRASAAPRLLGGKSGRSASLKTFQNAAVKTQYAGASASFGAQSQTSSSAADIRQTSLGQI